MGATCRRKYTSVGLVCVWYVFCACVVDGHFLSVRPAVTNLLVELITKLQFGYIAFKVAVPFHVYRKYHTVFRTVRLLVCCKHLKNHVSFCIIVKGVCKLVLKGDSHVMVKFT